ncbi:MAG TPA: hypothetical protein VM076_04060 [Gemmatimonadaceae bacterium]|nr:hypothetical protein [Gemmatimonadaceae bacterium]
MSTKEVFVRVVIYGLVLSAIDAVSGRFFQASPDPIVVLFIGATAWTSYRLAQAGQERLAIPAALTLAVVYAAGFVMWAALLVGWNGSVPWHPRSATWVAVVLAAAPVAAFLTKSAGTNARVAATKQQPD